jgi:hypothetical protein
LAEALGDPNLLAHAHQMAALALVEDPSSARPHRAKALELLEKVGNRSLICATYNDCAMDEMFLGDFVAARVSLEAALDHAVTPRYRAAVLLNLGLVMVREGSPEAAQSNLRDALRQLVHIGLFKHVPAALLGLAMASSASGSLERAAILHGAADATLAPQGVPWEPLESSDREKDIDDLRRRMGHAVFEAAYSRGHEMTGSDPLVFALDPDAQDLGDAHRFHRAWGPDQQVG